jgi:tetratricopeptide (TPR) repeat protein
MPRPLPPAGAAAPLAPVVKRALELHRQNSVGEAEELCLEVLELAPGQPEALALLYRIRHAQGAERAAETLLRRIVTLYPNTFWATNELTLALLAKGAITEAEIHARNAVRIAPKIRNRTTRLRRRRVRSVMHGISGESPLRAHCQLRASD